MTRIECPSEAWDRECEQEERANTPTNGELIEELDAYGHLTWVVGFNDEWAEDPRCECPKFEACEGLVPLCKSCAHPEHRGDWFACFDFKISNHVEKGLVIAYHAVVNSDSGGFIDTGESGVVPLSKAPFNLPDYWASIGMDDGTPWTVDECKAVEICNDRWNKDLISEIARVRGEE
jgi:hypothetical protein